MYTLKLLRVLISNPSVLRGINFYVPDNYTRGRQHRLFVVPASRTNVLLQAALTRALRILNQICEVNSELDIFTCPLWKFKESALKCIADTIG